MRKISTLFLISLLISCSSDSTVTEPEVEQQTDDEIVIEENEEESFSFPFSLSIVLKNFSNPSIREGEFIYIDFIETRNNPSFETNLTSLASLDLNASIIENGQDNVLSFIQGSTFEQQEIITYNLDNGEISSVLRSDLLISEENCISIGSQFRANSTSIISFNNDYCEQIEGIIPIIRNYTTNESEILPKIVEARIGDSFNLNWATDTHYFFHFDNLDSQGQSTDQDGLIVYDSRSNEIIYEDRTSEKKIPIIDNQNMIVKKGSTLFDLVDLESRRTLFSNEVSISEGLIIGETIGNAQILGNKVGLMIFNLEELKIFPGIYDFESNSSISFDSEAYREYFRSSGIPVPNPIRQPKQHIFDIESQTFAVLYHGFTQGIIQEDNPDFIGLIFMNFEGEIIYEYEFERKPWLEQVMVKR
ncbi:hypothetical protein [Croceitalea sp. P059]|uniref:hypothetical protein n=1 Tax=Croceitalea sp. P059 TaxID=3075601 RepID=UPI002888918C|nr:hypothetical protein [Croceitalea sp. P059]MDT0539861.1 hypothetical protein [Croceitalea sp. P059]